MGGQPRRERVSIPAFRNLLATVLASTPRRCPTAAKDAPEAYICWASTSLASSHTRGCLRGMPLRSRWAAIVERCRSNRSASSTSVPPARYWLVSASISAGASLRWTGFESRPVSSRRPPRWPLRVDSGPPLRRSVLSLCPVDAWDSRNSTFSGGFESRPQRSTGRCEIDNFRPRHPWSASGFERAHDRRRAAGHRRRSTGSLSRASTPTKNSWKR